MALFIGEMAELIVEAYTKDPAQNLGFEGPPGIGKSEVILGVGRELRKVYPDFFVRTFILSQCGPEDFHIPWASNGKYGFLTHEDFIFNAAAHGVIFFDEAGNSTQDTMKAVQNMQSARMLGHHKIPDGIMFLFAQNRKQDRAGVNTMNTAFSNRIEWHQVECDFKAWETWAHKNGIDATIIGYLKKFPQSLFDFKPDRSINATPRTWAKCNKVLGSKFEFDRLCGLLGEGIATEYNAYKRLFGEFPDVKDIIANPKKCKLPVNKDAQFALANALAMWTTKENWGAFVEYSERMNSEYKFMYMKEAARINPMIGLKSTKEWTNYIVTNQKDLI